MSNEKLGLSAALSSSLSSSSSSPKPLSAVSSMASQFKIAASKPSSTHDAKKVSDKVSDIATRFGTTIDDAPGAAKLHVPAYRRKPPVTKPADPTVITESGGKVTDVAKRFAQSAAESATATRDADGDQGGFASAHDRFRRAEELEKKPTESLVSSFAKRIEVGASASFDAPDATERHVAGVTRTFESKGTELEPRTAPPRHPVGATSSKFEAPRAAPAPAAAKGAAEEPQSNSFANVSKLFEGGDANAQHVHRETSGLQRRKSTAEEDDASQNRFADAAKVFGGL